MWNCTQKAKCVIRMQMRNAEVHPKCGCGCGCVMRMQMRNAEVRPKYIMRMRNTRCAIAEVHSKCVMRMRNVDAYYIMRKYTQNADADADADA
jgi:hypothetical protein